MPINSLDTFLYCFRSGNIGCCREASPAIPEERLMQIARAVEGLSPSQLRVLIPSETHLRSLIKAITWRLVAGSTTFGLSYLFFHDSEKAAYFVLAEQVVKLLEVYIFVRIWTCIKWGYKPPSIPTPQSIDAEEGDQLV